MASRKGYENYGSGGGDPAAPAPGSGSGGSQDTAIAPDTGLAPSIQIRPRFPQQVYPSSGLGRFTGMPRNGGMLGTSLDTSATTLVTAYATADQSVTNSASLTNSTYLNLSLVGASTYFIQGWLYLISQSGGYKLDFGGGAATATNFVAEALIHETAGTALENSSTIVTSMTTTWNKATSSTFSIRINATIEVNAGGTFILRFAQNSAGGGGTTCTIKRGSWLQGTLRS